MHTSTADQTRRKIASKPSCIVSFKTRRHTHVPVGQFSPPDGSVVLASDDRMTLVFRRSPAGLQLVHGANVQINAIAE